MLDPLRAAVQAIPDSLPGRRNRALILVGFAAALRSSELARLAAGSGGPSVCPPVIPGVSAARISAGDDPRSAAVRTATSQ